MQVGHLQLEAPQQGQLPQPQLQLRQVAAGLIVVAVLLAAAGDQL